MDINGDLGNEGKSPDKIGWNARLTPLTPNTALYTALYSQIGGAGNGIVFRGTNGVW